jgi:hypothetical protein
VVVTLRLTRIEPALHTVAVPESEHRSPLHSKSTEDNAVGELLVGPSEVDIDGCVEGGALFEGPLLGAVVGLAIGCAVDGEPLGAVLGALVVGELLVGAPLGSNVGCKLGLPEGLALGSAVGDALGPAVGEPLGSGVGAELGSLVGATVGAALGLEVGDPVAGDSDGEFVGGHVAIWLGTGEDLQSHRVVHPVGGFESPPKAYAVPPATTMALKN